MERGHTEGEGQTRWTNDIKERRNNDLHALSKIATDKTDWRQLFEHVLDNNGH